MEIQLTEKQKQSFWAKVNKSGPTQSNMETPCWVWMACKNKKGYGLFGCKGKGYLTHRVAWVLANGQIPQGGSGNGICVCHRCDVRDCVNPAHLFLGTDTDNARDRDNKGRFNLRAGAKASNNLSREQLSEAQFLYASGKKTLRAVALQFGVAPSWLYRRRNPTPSVTSET